MALTCRSCLDGRSWRCEGSTCAQWQTRHHYSELVSKPVVALEPKRLRVPSPERLRVPSPMQRALSVFMAEGLNPSDLVNKLDGKQKPTYEQIRQIKRTGAQ